MAVTNIQRIYNDASVPVTVINHETPSDTGGPNGLTIGPGELHSGNMFVPWCSDGVNFDAKHIDVTVGKRTFKIWQAAQADGDRVRASTDTWHNPGVPIGGFAAVGPVESNFPFLGDVRELIITDRHLWLLPLPVIGLLEALQGIVSQTGFRICGDAGTRQVPSVPKSSAVAFSMAGVPSDEFEFKHPEARFLYRDSGKRYEFTIKSDGTVRVQPMPPSADPVLQTARTFNRVRDGDIIVPNPQFDLIAANGGRVFAKEKGVDRFYFAIIDNSFIHFDSLAPERREFSVPDTYFKLDPEFNLPSARIGDVMAPLMGDFAGHPAASKFPHYKFALAFGLLPAFVARVTRGVWHLIDSRPPLTAATAAAIEVATFANALRGFGNLFNPLADALQGFVNSNPGNLGLALPSYPHVQYCANPPSTGGSQFSIDFRLVLDIGVGHVHLHQQFEGITGGEIAALLATPTGTDWYSNPVQLYQFLNGPIKDADGYNDGTCNYYILAQLRDGTFALLFMDEQSFFSQRWRLADPSDHQGIMAALMDDLAQNPNKYPLWNPSTFWSPFRHGRIGSKSRLAVSAQVVLVTGDVAGTGNLPGDAAQVIYSTNFSWGTMDRTWRWRPLPANPQFFDALPDETVGPIDNSAYPQSIRLRDDMTIHIKGRHNGLAGRWCQRYLPADNGLAGELVPGMQPATGYFHPWRFVPEPIFTFADRFSHFFVYDGVDSRMKYYPIDIADPSSASSLQAADPNEMWAVTSGNIFIERYAFRIEALNIYWPPIGPPPQEQWAPASLYNDETLLRIVKRGSQWIAMHWDKRDDDMEPLSGLPLPVNLQSKTPTANISVTINPAIQIAAPPAVQVAYFWWVDAATAAVAYNGSNVWRIRMGAFDANGAVVQLLDFTLEAGFQYVAAAGVYQHQWVPTAAAAAQLNAYATDAGATAHGTSIWFEDMTGHVAPPDQIKWSRPLEMRVAVDPVKIPIGLPCSVTVTATDANTGAPLPPQGIPGSIAIENDPVNYKLGVRFQKTFTMIQPEVDPPPPGGKPRPLPRAHFPGGTASVYQYPDTVIPFVFYSPTLSIHAGPTTVPAGRPVQISVDVRDSQTNGPVPASLSIAGQNVGPANSPVVSPILSQTFAAGVVTVVVSAAGYPNVSFNVTAYTPALVVTVIPPLPGIGKPVQVIVHAVDSTAGIVPPGCRVWIDGINVAATDTPFTYTFHARRVGPLTNPSFVYSTGIVTAPGYPDAAINFGFDA
jgi:hypothetical protein